MLKQLPEKVFSTFVTNLVLIFNKSEYVLKCEMSAVQRRLYAHMQRSGVILTDGIDKGSSGSASGAKALNNTVMQLRKICNHPFLFEAFESSYARHLQLPGGIVNNVDLWRASGKFELLDRVLFKLLSRRHRCLIFSQFVSLLTVCLNYYCRIHFSNIYFIDS